VRLAITLLALVLTQAGCADPPLPEESRPSEQGADPRALAGLPGSRDLVFDREFLFVSMPGDSLVAIPWFFRSRSQAGGVERERNAWVHRGGTWEALARDRESTPPTRTPWRILPGSTIRLIVGQDDRIETLLFRDGGAEIETHLSTFVTEWTRPGGESIRLFEGSSFLPAGPIDGYVLDLSRQWEDPGQAPGDWIFLLDRGGRHIFLEELPSDPDTRPGTPYVVWTHDDTAQVEWSGVTIEWGDMRPFEPARRDIPSRWQISSPDDALSGLLVSLSSHLTAGEGEGPILPVSGLFRVEGALRLDGEEVPVVGVVRHAQR
jgi:hypothetical protein